MGIQSESQDLQSTMRLADVANLRHKDWILLSLPQCGD